MFVTHEVNGLESSMIVDDDQGVATTTVDGRPKGAGDVDVYESPGIRGLVQIVRMRQSSRVCFGAGRARWRWCVAEAARCIAGEFRKALEVCPPAVQAAVHEVSGVARGHDLDVRCGS
eukprot:5272507-Pleurochrysis_carterae.AAC.4